MVAGQNGLIFMNAEVIWICQGIVHIQRIGFHVVYKKGVGNIGKPFFVPPPGKKKQCHAGENQQKAKPQKQLPEGNSSMLFQWIT